jgi:hypothetical protein
MKPSKRLREIITKNCYLDLIEAVEKTDPKELVEVQCFYHGAVKDIKNILKNNQNKNIVLYDIGCGKRPTLGTYLRLLFPELTSVVCIDPQLDNNLAKNIRYMSLVDDGLLEFSKDSDFSLVDIAIVCCNHAHVNTNMVKKFLDNFKKWYYGTVPCCEDNLLPNIEGDFVKDTYNWSDKNILYK